METMLLMVSIWSWFGAIMTIICYLPQTVKTILSRNTVGLSKWFFILGFLCSIGWIMGSILQGVIDQVFNSLSLAVLISNVVGFICNLVIMTYKCYNSYKAKKTGVTEQVFCEQLFEKIKAKKAGTDKIIKIIDKL